MKYWFHIPLALNACIVCLLWLYGFAGRLAACRQQKNEASLTEEISCRPSLLTPTSRKL